MSRFLRSLLIKSWMVLMASCWFCLIVANFCKLSTSFPRRRFLNMGLFTFSLGLQEQNSSVMLFITPQSRMAPARVSLLTSRHVCRRIGCIKREHQLHLKQL